MEVRHDVILLLVLLCLLAVGCPSPSQAIREPSTQPTASADRSGRGAHQRIAGRLASMKILRFEVDDIEVREAFQFLRGYSGAVIHVDWNTLRRIGVHRSVWVAIQGSVTGAKVFELMLQDATAGRHIRDDFVAGQADYFLHGETLSISSRRDLSERLKRQGDKFVLAEPRRKKLPAMDPIARFRYAIAVGSNGEIADAMKACFVVGSAGAKYERLFKQANRTELDGPAIKYVFWIRGTKPREEGDGYVVVQTEAGTRVIESAWIVVYPK